MRRVLIYVIIYSLYFWLCHYTAPITNWQEFIIYMLVGIGLYAIAEWLEKLGEFIDNN